MKKITLLGALVCATLLGTAQVYTVTDNCFSLTLKDTVSRTYATFPKSELSIRKAPTSLQLIRNSQQFVVASWKSSTVSVVAPTLDSAFTVLKKYLYSTCSTGGGIDTSSNYWTLNGNTDSIFSKMLTNYDYLGVNVYGLQTGVTPSDGKFAGLRVLNPPGDFTTVIIGFEDSATDSKSITKSRYKQVETEVEGEGMESELKVTPGILSFGGDAGPYVLSFDREIGLYQIGNIDAETDLIEIDTATGIIKLKASDSINLESNFASITAPILSIQNFRYNSLPAYGNDGDADADTNLPSGGTYHITGDRTLKVKP